MQMTFDLQSVADYRRFLAVKSLPMYRIRGRSAWFPDEYAERIGVKAKAERFANYSPSDFLFDYQAAISAVAIRKKRFAVFADCGLGKTLILLEYLRHAADVLPKKKKLLVVSPLMVVKQTLAEAATFYRDACGLEQVKAAGLQDWLNGKGGRIGITNYDALTDDVEQGKLGCLVLDECFAKGTKVACVDEYDRIFEKHIENIVSGDTIINAWGKDKVSSVSRKEVRYAVVVNAGKKITCSPNHPFFTRRGWVCAQDLRPGDSIAQTKEAMRIMRSGILTANCGGRIAKILQSILLSEVAYVATGPSCESTYEGGTPEDWPQSLTMAAIRESEGQEGIGQNPGIESDDQPINAEKGFCQVEEYGAQTFRAWGQRAWLNCSADDFDECTWTELEGGVLLVTGPAGCRLSNALQARFSTPREENRRRGGWSLTLLQKAQRPEEGCEAGFVRVDGVAFLESGHPDLERFREADGKLYFYDIQAARHPSFTVNGLLVHNSSMLKSMYGKWGQTCIRLGKGLEWKLCATGTPAPNDRIEYGNHAVFLDHFPTLNAFLAKYFVNRGQTDNRWELKPHALEPFYRSLSHWCIFLTNPATYGWKDNCESIPPINVHIHDVDLTDEQNAIVTAKTGQLFATNIGGIVGRTTLGRIAKGNHNGRKVATEKPEFIRRLVESWPDESTIIWCLYNDEQAGIAKLFPDAASISGDTPLERRMELIDDFKAGKRKILISKPKILGFGLNLQIATRQVFSGLQDSYESFYQAVKRSNRYGSTRPLNVHIPVTDLERPMIETVLAKSKRVQHDTDAQERIFRDVAGTLGGN
jgi:superfamily II DNA or RNA helicase